MFLIRGQAFLFARPVFLSSRQVLLSVGKKFLFLGKMFPDFIFCKVLQELAHVPADWSDKKSVSTLAVPGGEPPFLFFIALPVAADASRRLSSISQRPPTRRHKGRPPSPRTMGCAWLCRDAPGTAVAGLSPGFFRQSWLIRDTKQNSVARSCGDSRTGAPSSA
jgi:hypothetical protein